MNSFRIGVIGVLVDKWGIALAEGFIHDFEGWIIFMACMVLLFIEMFILTKIGKGKARPLFEVFGLTIPNNIEVGQTAIRKISYPLFGIIFLLVISVFIVGSLEQREELILARKTFPEFPEHLADWTGRQKSMESRIIEKLQLSDYILSNYTKPGSTPVNFYVAYYESQRKGVSPHSPRVCIPGGGWQISDISRTQVDNYPVNRIVIKKEQNTQLVYYWFQQRGRLIANEYLMKWYLFKDALLLNRTDGALVRITTTVSSGELIDNADERLREFLEHLRPILPDYIPE
jgi:exosortase D (VPLPA-CTERM-specific)